MRAYTFTVGAHTYTVKTDSGVFSTDRLDKGTAVLLDAFESGKLPIASNVTGDIVDLGCGAGPLTLVMAKQFPQCRVWAVDINERARELCKANAKENHLSNINVVAPNEIPADLTIALLWSNPPVRIGKEALHELLATWMQRLDATGVAYLVMSKNLGADSLHAWLTELGYTVTKCASRKGFRVLSVSRRADLNS